MLNFAELSQSFTPTYIGARFFNIFPNLQHHQLASHLTRNPIIFVPFMHFSASNIQPRLVLGQTTSSDVFLAELRPNQPKHQFIYIKQLHYQNKVLNFQILIEALKQSLWMQHSISTCWKVSVVSFCFCHRSSFHKFWKYSSVE